ncbi:MAG: hypothetical protein KZQ75_04245 [Candidatus Thiodiazotropha sp. (ex Myrtea spinifera)]|nr:hypothetical protein [Candidatus Thiodiazotropha sp. (ex Myrtea spinifera)]
MVHTILRAGLDVDAKKYHGSTLGRRIGEAIGEQQDRCVKVILFLWPR